MLSFDVDIKYLPILLIYFYFFPFLVINFYHYKAFFFNSIDMKSFKLASPIHFSHLFE